MSKITQFIHSVILVHHYFSLHSWTDAFIMSDAVSIVLSLYASSLQTEAKSCYLDKVKIIGGIDPFCTTTLGRLKRSDDCPPVDACDLLSYLKLQTSFITTEQFVARKGLEAYNQYVCGWVKDILSYKADGKFITTGRVRNTYCI